MSQLLKPSDLKLRPQVMPERMLNLERYCTLVRWPDKWDCDAYLAQHKRTGALWLIADGEAQVVRRDRTVNAFLELIKERKTQ